MQSFTDEEIAAWTDEECCRAFYEFGRYARPAAEVAVACIGSNDIQSSREYMEAEPFPEAAAPVLPIIWKAVEFICRNNRARRN